MISIFKILAIVISILFFSVIALIVGSIDRSFKVYFWLTRRFADVILFISGISFEAKGLNNFSSNGIYVYVSNHASMFDIPILQKTFPNNVSIIFKKELSKIPFFGWALNIGPYISIDRSNADKAMSSIEKAKMRMKEKNISIIIFAEGTRSLNGEVQPFKRGAFYLASRAGFPIIPVSINGTDKILKKGSLNIKPGKIVVYFGEPINPPEVVTKQEELALMEKVRNEIIKNKEMLNASNN